MTSTRRTSHKFVRSTLRSTGGTETPSVRVKISEPAKTKNALRRFVLGGQRPTDLCATALFSFQGTNAGDPLLQFALRQAQDDTSVSEGTEKHGTGVTTSIIPRPGSGVKHERAPVSHGSSCDFSRSRRRCAFSRFPHTRMLHQAPEPFFERSKNAHRQLRLRHAFRRDHVPRAIAS